MLVAHEAGIDLGHPHMIARSESAVGISGAFGFDDRRAVGGIAATESKVGGTQGDYQVIPSNTPSRRDWSPSMRK
jgi:hypothetical protein